MQSFLLYMENVCLNEATFRRLFFSVAIIWINAVLELRIYFVTSSTIFCANHFLFLSTASMSDNLLTIFKCEWLWKWLEADVGYSVVCLSNPACLWAVGSRAHPQIELSKLSSSSSSSSPRCSAQGVRVRIHPAYFGNLGRLRLGFSWLFPFTISNQEFINTIERL